MKKVEDYTAAELFALASQKKKEEDKKFIACKFFKCRQCDKSSRLDKWSRVYDHYYDDDPYNPNWFWDRELLIICPKCLWLNRMYDQVRWRQDPIKHTIKATIDEYVKRGGKFAEYYSTYSGYSRMDCNRIIPIRGSVEYWDHTNEMRIEKLPYIDTVNIPDKVKKK